MGAYCSGGSASERILLLRRVPRGLCTGFLIRNSLMSVIFLPVILGPEMAMPVFLWAPGVFGSFRWKTPMPIKFLVLGAGFLGGAGGGKCCGSPDPRQGPESPFSGKEGFGVQKTPISPSFCKGSFLSRKPLFCVREHLKIGIFGPKSPFSSPFFQGDGKWGFWAAPPDPPESPETGNPENAIFETKNWTFGGVPSNPFK